MKLSRAAVLENITAKGGRKKHPAFSEEINISFFLETGGEFDILNTSKLASDDASDIHHYFQHKGVFKMKLDSIILTQEQIFLTTDPLPITAVNEWKNKEGVTLGSSIEVVIPRRNFEKIAVKVKGCPLYKTFNPDKPMMADFKGVTARAYAFAGKQGIISGWAATAESLELSEGGDFL